MKRFFHPTRNALSRPRVSRQGKLWAIILAFAVSLAASSAPVHAQVSRPLSATTRAQIDALTRERESRTPTQKKINSQLLFAAREDTTGRAVESVPSVRAMVDREGDGRVKVRITATVTPGLLGAIGSLGGVVTGSYPAYRAVYATFPPSSLETLAAREEVQFIGLPSQMFTNTRKPTFDEQAATAIAKAVAPPQVSAVDTAVNDPEGDATHGAAAVRTQLGIDGTGIKVGVLSNSIDDATGSYAKAVTAGYVPNNITVLPGQAGSTTDDGEGLAMLEVVHRIAPGATLYYATADNGPEQMAENIKTMGTDGCKVILDDISFGVEDPFQDDTLSLAVDTVTAGGALYFSCAANNYNLDSGKSSCWEGNFVSTNNDGFLDFNNGTGAAFNEENTTASFEDGAKLTVIVYFAEPLNGAASQYNLYEINSANSVVQEADDDVTTTKTNYQGLVNVAAGDLMAVQLASGSPRFLHMNIVNQFSTLEIATQGRALGHNAGLNSLCCAATPAGVAQSGVPYTTPTGPYPNLFNSSNKIEPFSNDGPRHIFFNADGSAITPGNFLASGGTILAKPDFTAADGVTTSVPQVGGDSPFFGTSCATPHAGALAALAWSGKLTATPAQVKAALKAGTVQITTPGPGNRDAGAGILLASNIATALGVTGGGGGGTAPTITNFTPDSGPVGTTVTINGTNFTGLESVTFNGVASTGSFTATQIIATVPTGATTGKIVVATSAGSVSSATSFTVTGTGGKPVITSATTATGTIGKAFSYRITATNSPTGFAASGLPAGLSVGSTTGLISGTPTATGTFAVVIAAANTAGSSTASLSLTINATASTVPTITGFSPASGAVGATVTITGTNFVAPLSVIFAGNVAAVHGFNATTINATVPSGALTGPIKIVANGGTVSTATSFTVTGGGPTITSFSPASGAVGSTVVIKGSGFTTPLSVIFAGNVAAVHSVSATQVNAVVPSGAVTGKIKIVTNAGTVLTATNFTVTVAPPVITTGAAATVNKAFSYQIVARGSPTSYAVYGLPAGLSVNATSGLISGTPTTAGTYALTLVAVNGGGTGTAGLNIVVANGSF